VAKRKSGHEKTFVNPKKVKRVKKGAVDISPKNVSDNESDAESIASGDVPNIEQNISGVRDASNQLSDDEDDDLEVPVVPISAQRNDRWKPNPIIDSVWHESTEDLALLPITADAICNCVEFGLEECLLFNEEFINDMGKIIDNSEGKLPNELRFSLYKLSFKACNFGIRMKGVRKEQPKCVVAKIKLLCPSNSNEYVGFKEQIEDN
jgi:hypothetical protein